MRKVEAEMRYSLIVSLVCGEKLIMMGLLVC